MAVMWFKLVMVSIKNCSTVKFADNAAISSLLFADEESYKNLLNGVKITF